MAHKDPEASREYARRYYQEHKEESRERDRRYRKENPERCLERGKRYRKNHPDKVKESSQLYYKNHIEQERTRGLLYYQENRDHEIARHRQWQQSHREDTANHTKTWRLNYPERASVSDRNKRAKRRSAKGFHTEQNIQQQYQSQDGLCAYCGEDLSSGYQVEHVHPLVKGGSNWPDNLVLACQSCNGSKHDKLFPEEWTPANA